MAKIFFVRGPLRRQEHPLKPEGFTLGRAPGNDVILPDDSVSRRHCRFFQDGARWMVADMGSLNGIRVNGETARERVLMDRDVVVVGRSDIAFLERDDSDFSIQDRTADLRRALKGRYTVERQLGSGAQADVYKARRLDGTPCAIKVLTRPAEAGTGDVRRFLREARALMALRHKNIVEILEVDDCEDLNFMVLEFLGGGSLEERLERQKRLPWRDGLRLLAELARGLVHAHARGIYHRDIKPANVLYRDDGAAVLTDFGIAQILETTKLTRTGMVFGTPYFMSPGRLAGEPASDQSDLYALGATVFVSITGQYPFPGAEVDDIIRAMKLGEAVPAHLLEPSVPKPLSDLLARLLHRTSTGRIETSGELLREIDLLPRDMADGPAPEDRVGGNYRVEKFLYLTDVGLTFLADDLDGAAPCLLKVATPQVAAASDLGARLARLQEATGCRALRRGPLAILITTAPAGRTLQDLTSEVRSKAGLPPSLALSLALGVAESLAALPVPHGDVDAATVALTPAGVVELLDVGYATLLDPATYAVGRRSGTKLPLTAPEVLTGGGPTSAADVYALGSLLFWLVTGMPPIEPGPQVERIEKIMTGRIREDSLRAAGLHDSVVAIVKGAMAVIAKKRPSPADVASSIRALGARYPLLPPPQLAEFLRSPRTFAAS